MIQNLIAKNINALCPELTFTFSFLAPRLFRHLPTGSFGYFPQLSLSLIAFQTEAGMQIRCIIQREKKKRERTLGQALSERNFFPFEIRDCVSERDGRAVFLRSFPRLVIYHEEDGMSALLRGGGGFNSFHARTKWECKCFPLAPGFARGQIMTDSYFFAHE